MHPLAIITSRYVYFPTVLPPPGLRSAHRRVCVPNDGEGVKLALYMQLPSRGGGQHRGSASRPQPPLLKKTNHHVTKQDAVVVVAMHKQHNHHHQQQQQQKKKKKKTLPTTYHAPSSFNLSSRTYPAAFRSTAFKLRPPKPFFTQSFHVWSPFPWHA